MYFGSPFHRALVHHGRVCDSRVCVRKETGRSGYSLQGLPLATHLYQLDLTS